MQSQIDYVACYQVLGLQPGATLKEIEERARFLRIAFHPDKFQEHMRDEATERLKPINVALDNLRAYWKARGTAPPVGQRPPPPPPRPPEQKPQPPPPEPKPQSPPHAETPPSGAGERTQRTTRRPRRDQYRQPGVYQVYEDANRLAMHAGYDRNIHFLDKLEDLDWWKCLWRALDLAENKPAIMQHDGTTIEGHGYEWERSVCLFHLCKGIKIDTYFKFFFDRNVRFWRDPNVRLVYLSPALP